MRNSPWTLEDCILDEWTVVLNLLTSIYSPIAQAELMLSPSYSETLFLDFSRSCLS